jgi:hypothetical protein
MYYQIKGTATTKAKRKYLGGVRVEAWAKDDAIEDYLAYTLTQPDGTFVITLDDDMLRDLFRGPYPQIYFRVWCGGVQIGDSADSAYWTFEKPNEAVTIECAAPKPMAWTERHVFLKIERMENYSPVKPLEEEAGQAKYGRDCMRNVGHEDGVIPRSEITARSLDAVVYREYLDSAYLLPKPDKLIMADINEPLYENRVPGTVIYTHPYQRLKIHVWNDDDVPHSAHTHGLVYGIDSDGTWPFGTQAGANGPRSDAICPGETWVYTFDITEYMLGPWPFHDYTHYSNIKIEQGLFGGIVVLDYCDRPPQPFRFREGMLDRIYADLERVEGRNFCAKEARKFDEDCIPFMFERQIHVKRLKPETLEILENYHHFLEEFVSRAFSLQTRHIPTDHVPVFFHRMSRRETPAEPEPVPPRPVDPVRPRELLQLIRPLDLGVALEQQPRIANLAAIDLALLPDPRPLFPGRVVRPIPSLCINGRSFVGNTPTIVGRAGQRIRWYVFNLDVASNAHNFHVQGMRWTFAGENVDTRSFGPGESFIVEATIPPVLLLTEAEARCQDPQHRPKDARLFSIKGDFLFHCHEHEHLLGGMAGLVRAKQTLWLTELMANEITRRTGLPLDDGLNSCPDVEPNPCGPDTIGRWETVAGAPETLLMHSILLPNTQRVLFWGQTRADQARLWDYSTPAGSYLSPNNQTADLTGNVGTSDMWSAAHAILDTPEGLVLIQGGFSPNRCFTFNPDPAVSAYTQVQNTANDRFYAMTLVIGDGRALVLFGSASKSIEAFTLGVGWAPPIAVPPSMNHHEYYPWTYLLPSGLLFIAGPHTPSQRFDFNNPAATVESLATGKGNRSTGGEKGSSVMLILRPPDYAPTVYRMGGNVPGIESSVEQIDLSAPIPQWEDLPDLNNARAEQFTATLLPDGRVFVAGGISGGGDGGPCEIFDPREPGGDWIVGPNMLFERTYHSSFILLQDGSVLGGGAPPNVAFPPFTPHERFFPGYFDKVRPVINGAPATINYGGNFTINTPTPLDISEVVLLRPGAVTHGFNLSQRGIELVIAGTGAGTLNVQTPPTANHMPPGWHLLFILDFDRVPSEGRWIRLTP